MEPRSALEGARERFQECGKLLLSLAEEPNRIEELLAAVEQWNQPRFRAVLGSIEFNLPPEKCDPYVRVFVLLLKPPKFHEECKWKRQMISPDTGAQLGAAFVGGLEADQVIALLKQLGLIECVMVREEQHELIKESKFVQGICPPGTY